MVWKLFLDDIRMPIEPGYVIARSSIEGIELCKSKTLPKFISFDHDLGVDDDAMIFLKELFLLWEQEGSDESKIPNYQVHSANPVGAKNIISYMDSWKKAYNQSGTGI